MKKQFLILFALAAMVFTSCDQAGNGDETNNNNDQNPKETGAELPSEVEDNLQDLLDEYYKLKDALVESKPEDAADNAREMQEIIGKTGAGEVEGLENRLNQLRQHLQPLAQAEGIEEQRQHFEMVSDQMHELVKQYRFNDETVYRQHCPMAFDDKGASWLSDQEQIRNPYFGDRMLKCGSVEEEIK